MASNVSHQLSIVIGAALGSGFNSAISGSTSKIGQIGAAIKDMEKQSTLSGRSLESLKSKYNSFLASMNNQQRIIQKRAFYRSQIMDMVALGAALVAPVKSAIEFEKALGDIKSVVKFPTPEGLSQLGNTLTSLSMKIPMTATELAKIAAIGGRFGVVLKELPFFTEEVAKSAKAWGMTADEASEKVGNLTKTFNIQAKELPYYFDAINHLGNLTGATAKDILIAINRSGDGLANFKLSLPQAAALTSTIVSFGETAEQAGTLVTGMLQKLSIAPRLGAGAQKAFRSIGLSAKVLPEMIAQDPQKVLNKLFDGLSKFAPEKRAGVLYQIFGRGPSKMVGKLIENLDLYKKNLQYVSDANRPSGSDFKGSRDEDYGIVFDTTASKLALLSNTVSAFGKEIGNSLLPTIGSLCDSLNGLMTPIINFMQANKELTTTITKTVAGFIGFRIASFALGYASTFLFGGLNKLLIVFKGLRLGLALAATALRSFISVGGVFKLIAAAWILIKNWERVRSFFINIWDVVEPYWLKFKSILDEFGITDKIITSWNTVANFFGNIWESAKPHWLSFKSILDSYGITDKIMASWMNLKEFFAGIWSSILPQLEKFSNLTSKIWNSAKSPFSAIGNLFSSNDNKASLTSKLPSIRSANAAPITKNQNTNVVVNVNASKITDSKEVAKQVSREMKNFNWSYLYDPIGELP